MLKVIGMLGGAYTPSDSPNSNAPVLVGNTNGQNFSFPYGAEEIHEKYLQQIYF